MRLFRSRFGHVLIYISLFGAIAACTPVHKAIQLTPVIQKDHYTASIQKLDDQRLELRVYNDAQPVDIDTTNRVLHLTLVSDDLLNFFHGFKEFSQQEPGVYIIQYPLQNIPYRVWLDIPDLETRDHHGDRIQYRGTTILQPDAVKTGGLAEQGTEVDVGGGYSAKLTLPKELFTGGSAVVPTVTLYDPQHQPIATVQNADHFYTLVGSSEEYRLEHVAHELSTDTTLALHPLIFKKSGMYSLWMEIYVQNGNTIETFRPRFTFFVPNWADVVQ